MPTDKRKREDSELTEAAKGAQRAIGNDMEVYNTSGAHFLDSTPSERFNGYSARAGAGQRAVASGDSVSERTAADMRRTAHRQDQAQKKDSKKRGYAKGGSVGFKHDGIAKSGKTKGKFR